jgi:hypothetical protein
MMPLPVELDLVKVYSPDEEELEDIEKMKEASLVQESKMRRLMEGRKISKPRVVVSLKRKVSECTEAPNSPQRKRNQMRR